MRRMFTGGRYANVASTMALVVALGGTSYAALKLPSNSVGSKQIKKNAVTGAKVKKDTLTGADINEAKLGKVPAAAAADNATKAANADNAAHAANADRAGSADTATNADHAASADAVGGARIVKVQSREPADGPPLTVYDDASMALQLTCPSSEPQLTVTTKVNHALFRSSYVGLVDSSTDGKSDFGPTDAPAPVFRTNQSRGTLTLVYTYEGGPVIDGTFAVDDANTYGNFAGCSVTGTVTRTS